MNADSYLLLNSVLGDRPCIDPGLTSTVQTAPFAVQALAQQCYYFLYLYSCVKAQLSNTASAYNTLVQFMLAQQQPRSEEDPGKAAPQPPTQVSWPLALPPTQPTSNLELRLTIVGGGSVARCLLRRLLRDGSDDISSSSLPSRGAGSTTSLLFHPSRITVLTGQPQNLAEFAMRGVKCVSLTHGKAPISASDLVVLACQPQQLPEVVKELFTAAAAPSSHTSPPTQAAASVTVPPAKLKDTAVVVSVLAAVPRGKIAASLGHDARLILRTELETLSQLPAVAANYEKASEDCAALQVRYMADRDSFLCEAVEEAEANAIAELAEKMAATAAATALPSPHNNADGGSPVHTNGGPATTMATLPKDLALRAAVRAATRATVTTRFLPPPRPALLLEMATPRKSFFLAAWATLQQVVRGFLATLAAAEERRGGRGTRSTKSRAALLAKAAPAAQGPTARKYGKARPQDGAEAKDAAEMPLVQLCASLAMLPDHGCRLVAMATLHRYGALPPDGVALLSPLRDTNPPSNTSRVDTPRAQDDDAAGRQRPEEAQAVPEPPTAAVPRAYKNEPDRFWTDTEQQFCAILTLK